MVIAESIQHNGLDECLARFLFPNVIGNSLEFLTFLGKVYSLAQNNEHVLLIGETGTGKTFYAKIIWEHSNYNTGPLVSLDCSQVHRDITLAVLQGHARGAFTGAYKDNPGKIEESKGGALLIENVDHLSFEGQAVLANFIDEGTVQRIGDNYIRKVNTKLILTINKTLRESITSGAIDRKLYYRLVKHALTLPSLKKIKNDLYFIAKHYCTDILNIKISQKALKCIQNYRWPGNFRELFTCLEHVSAEAHEIINDFNIISYINSVSFPNGSIQTNNHECFDFTDFNLDTHLKNVEITIIEKALEETNGVQSIAAKLLGIKERSLWHRIKTLGIKAK